LIELAHAESQNSRLLVKNFTKLRILGGAVDAGLAFKQTFELINPHLYSVEERIRQQARAFDPAVEGYIAYAINSGGKRLRPALALLAGGATGKITSGHVDVAVILELIHVATLVHDDIMDGAETRREQPTVNAKWGNSLSVLLGDCLFAHALRLSTNFSNNEICRIVSEAATEVCTGEILQTQRRFDLNLSLPDYYRIIEMKTAALFAAACELGAFISEASPEIISALKTFGLRLGTAYQIYDDCLDIVGDEATAGKTLGTDLEKGKLTLPVLLLLQSSDEGRRTRVRELLLHENHSGHAELVDLLTKSGAMTSAIDTAKRMVAEARALVEPVPANRYLNGLLAVAGHLEGLLAQFK
jgi:octaprenyl-diphosphate synthase